MSKTTQCRAQSAAPLSSPPITASAIRPTIRRMVGNAHVADTVETVIASVFERLTPEARSRLSAKELATIRRVCREEHGKNVRLFLAVARG